MKYLLAILFVFIASSLPAINHLPGDTITNNKGYTLQVSVRNEIMGFERKLAPACHGFRITQTTIAAQPRVLGRMMQWQERWTIDRCGKAVDYFIAFDFRGSTGTYKITGPSS